MTLLLFAINTETVHSLIETACYLLCILFSAIAVIPSLDIVLNLLIRLFLVMAHAFIFTLPVMDIKFKMLFSLTITIVSLHQMRI